MDPPLHEQTCIAGLLKEPIVKAGIEDSAHDVMWAALVTVLKVVGMLEVAGLDVLLEALIRTQAWPRLSRRGNAMPGESGGSGAYGTGIR